jgi:hypothetical protein
MYMSIYIHVYHCYHSEGKVSNGDISVGDGDSSDLKLTGGLIFDT